MQDSKYPNDNLDKCYVAIGASWESLEAINEFFLNMPVNINVAFIIIQHFSSTHKSIVISDLSKVTDIPIHNIQEGDKVYPNTIYLSSPEKITTIKHDKLYLEDMSSNPYTEFPINDFFESLSKVDNANIIGITLSGLDFDGVDGIKYIKKVGGLTIAQEPKVVDYSNVDNEIINMENADFIISPSQMPRIIKEYIQNRLNFVNNDKDFFLNKENITAYQKITSALLSYTNVDFSLYKENTIVRKIKKRMSINHIHDINAYLDLLLNSNEEKKLLYKDILIRVTSFFRDEDAFKSLYENIIKTLFNNEKDEIRIWSIACSTGEEVYSIAILINEYMEKESINKTVKIFATDVDKKSISYAQEGIYNKTSVESISKEIINKYFDNVNCSYKIKDKIRKMIVFAEHDILKDIPFSRLDLIVCRNLFIYIKSKIQKKILQNFHKLINNDGFLFLGNSEFLGELSEAYTVVDKKWKIYKKNFDYNVVKSVEQNILIKSKSLGMENNIIATIRHSELIQILEKVFQAVIAPSILIDNDGRILRILKDIDRYLYHYTDEFENDIHTYLKNEINNTISNIVDYLKIHRRDIICKKLSGLRTLENECICISVDKINLEDKAYYLIQVISKQYQIKDTLCVTQGDSKDYRIKELEKLLNESNICLQNAIEELELRNEELQASNEEMIASNEELQSINEELCIINNEYQNKIDELIKSNSDFNNLLVNAEIGALYIDNNLCIRKITPIMVRNTNLLIADEGRSILHVRFMNNYKGFIEDIKYSLTTLRTVEKEVIDNNGITWLVRSRPYYESTNKLGGVLTTIFDITKRLEAAKYELKLLTDSIPGGVVKFRYDGGLFIEYANDGLYALGAYTAKQFEEIYNKYYDRVIIPEDWESVNKIIQKCIKSNELIKVNYRIRAKDGDTRWRFMQAFVLENKNKPIIQGIISSVDDLILTQQNLNSLIQNIPGGIIRAFFDGVTIKLIFASEQVYKLFGYDKEEYEQLSSQNSERGLFVFKESMNDVYESIKNVFDNGDFICNEYNLKNKDGDYIWVQLRGNVVSRDSDGIIIQYVITDITSIKEAFFALEQERAKLDVIVEISSDLLFEYNIKNKTMYYTNKSDEILNPKQITQNYRETILQWSLVHEEDTCKIKQFCDELEQGKPNINIELRKRYADGKYHWIEISGKTINDEYGRPFKVIGKTINIDERKEKEYQLKIQSELDSLTNIYNQITIKNIISNEIDIIKNNETAAIILIDIDDFKNINDSQGHLFGDAVLSTVADEMKQVFNSNCYVGRIGGDEFIVFVKNQEHNYIEEMVKMFIYNISKIYVGESNEGNSNISCSIGIAEYPECGKSYIEIFKKADTALYYVKNNQKGNFEFYDFKKQVEIIDEKISYLSGYDLKQSRSLIDDKYNNLIIFALELIDKAKNIKSAVNMILDRVSRTFGLDEVLLISVQENHFTTIDFKWNKSKRHDFKRKSYLYDDKSWISLEQKYDQNDIAIFKPEDFKFDEEFANHFKTALFIKIYDENCFKGIMAFLSCEKKYLWKKGEKGVLKNIASILSSQINHIKKVEEDNKQIDFLINYDCVTSLPNYSRFKQISEHEISENKDNKYFIVYTDFSNFKYINGVFGYAEGDMILDDFSKTLIRDCKHGVHYSRINADNFVLLLKGDDIDRVKDEYVKLSLDFCNKINQRYTFNNIILTSGICEINNDMISISTAIDNANIARKSIKHLAETKCAKFTDDLRNKMTSQMEMTANMFKALEEHEFVVYLQPKISLKTKKIIGAEALVRWQRKSGSLFYPDMFIPLFENNGFITKIDYYVLEEVLKWLKKMIDLGESVVPISLNFSRKHQEDMLFVERVTKMLKQYDIPSKYIEAEITESVFMSDLNVLNQNIHKMKKNGIAISIDDFGSGYSSLNVLASVSVDVIKLDKEFLKQLNNDNQNMEFFKYLIGMIKQLGFQVIAEGVETKEQEELLQRFNCDMAQGYYYAKPMPIENFKKYVEEHNNN